MAEIYKSSEVADRIRLLAKAKNISVSTMFSEIGLGKNTLMNFKTSMPKADNIAKIADYLDVSVDYLLGRTDNPMISSGSCYVGDNKNGIVQTNNGSAVVNTNLTEQKSADIIGQFLQAFDKLKIEDKVEVMYFALQKAKTTKE